MRSSEGRHNFDNKAFGFSSFTQFMVATQMVEVIVSPKYGPNTLLYRPRPASEMPTDEQARRHPPALLPARRCAGAATLGVDVCR